MREIWLVLRREFLERVRSRSFVIGTMAFPLTVGIMMFLPSVLDRGEERTVVVVDETATGVGNVLAERLGVPPAERSDNSYRVEVYSGPAATYAEALNLRAEERSIHGYLVIPPDVFTSNEVAYRSGTIASPGMLRELQTATSEALRGERLRVAGIDPATIAEVVQPVRVDNLRVDGTGAERGDAQGTFLLAYLLSFVIYFMVLFYGVSVMRSVLEEKTSRIAEVLVSSLRSTHLMAGKVIGVASAALLQVLIWALLVGLLVTQSDAIAARMEIEPKSFAALSLEPGIAILLLTYFLLGFFLFAGLFAMLGAAVTSEQEAQSFQMVLVLPLVVPLAFLVPLTAEPLGRAATILGLFPLTSPIAMPMRLAAAAIPPGQVVLSLALLAAALVASGWAAGKIYRIGILATGKRPGVRELIHWLRMT